MWFSKKVEKATPVELDSTEKAYARAWGFNDSQWQAMTPAQRADYRDRVSQAFMRVGA